MKKIISTPEAPAAIGPYSQGICLGKHIFLSGQLGLDPKTGELVSENVKEQTAQALRNMKAALKAAGAEPANVIKTTVFILDMKDFAAVNEEYAKVFTGDFPARSCVAVAALPKGGKVEIEAIAIVE